MGSAQSYISPEAALTTLVVAGAIGLGYTQIGHGSASTKASATVSSSDATSQTDKSGKPTNKGKKKKQAKSSVVLSGGISDKGRANINDKSQLLTISSTTLAESGCATNVNAPVGFPGQFESIAIPGSQVSDVAAVASSSVSKAKKAKKKKAKATVTTDPAVQQATASSSADYSSEVSLKPKTKNAKRHQQPQPSSSSQMTRTLQQSTASIDTDGSWTRVGSVRRDTALSKNSTTSLDASNSDADTGLTPHTGNSSPTAERGAESEEPSSFLLNIGARDSGQNRRKTLAEKLLPKPRKTGVDDMVETSDYPTLARVIRVQPRPDEKPASGFSWGDYEDVRVTTDGGENDDEEDDSWGVVTSKRQRVDRASTSTLTSSSHHQTQKASETMTKRQRQNAQRRENEKEVKAEAEVQRLAVLAKHKRELERTRMLEQYGGKSGGKSSSGGMKASVDERGKLVWE